MFCTRCGIENAQGVAFCKNCGASFLNASEANTQQQTYTPPVYQKKVREPLSTNPVLNEVKKLATSPLFLVAIIAFSAQILFTFIGAFNTASTMRWLYTLLDGELGYYLSYDVLDAIYSTGGAAIVTGTIIGLIPSGIICAGLWMTYASARNRQSITMSTAGLTMIKVVSIIGLIGTCILSAIIVIAMIIVTIAMSQDPYVYGRVVALFVFLTLLFVAAYTIIIIYQAKVISSINTVKNTIYTAVPSDKVSGFVAVWAFIQAGFLLFSLITNFFVAAASMTALICFGILIFNYKKTMRNLMYK